MENKDRTGQIILLWVLVIILMILICAPSRCVAQIDTVNCKIECITKLFTTTTEKGKNKIFAVYKDPTADVEEIIPMSKSVLDYINACKQYDIRPTLGIRLRNGVITSIIRIKSKYRRK